MTMEKGFARVTLHWWFGAWDRDGGYLMGFIRTTTLPRGNLLIGIGGIWIWVVYSAMECIAFSKPSCETWLV